jgi:hypothetical protein
MSGEAMAAGEQQQEWTERDLDEYGSYATRHFAHSQMYFVRDVSRRWCEEACARDDMRTARRCAQRAGRADELLRAWVCAGCAICPGPGTSRTRRPVAPPARLGTA